MPSHEPVSPEIRAAVDEAIRIYMDKLWLEMRGRIGYCSVMRRIYEAQGRLK